MRWLIAVLVGAGALALPLAGAPLASAATSAPVVAQAPVGYLMEGLIPLSDHPNRCLAAANTGIGEPVITLACNKHDRRQVWDGWMVTASPRATSGTGQIEMAVNPRACLGSARAGDFVALQACEPDAQNPGVKLLLNFRAVKKASVIRNPQHSGFYLYAPGSRGGNIVFWAGKTHGYSDERWNVPWVVRAQVEITTRAHPAAVSSSIWAAVADLTKGQVRLAA